MTRQRSVFDIIGPVMIGPSSSHTAGAVRLGQLARAVFGAQPRRARVLLHGSFASTGKGHGTGLALIAGLLGLGPADGRIPEAVALAESAGLSVTFESADLGEVHPNTAQFELADADRHMELRGSSLGGGDVLVTDIDGFEVAISGELPVLVVEHRDRPGEIAAVTTLLADSGVNIASMQVSREQRGARALMLIETDAEIPDRIADRIAQQPGVTSVRRVPSI
jgi:L-serine dehydratase